MAPTALNLNAAFTAIALAFGNLPPIIGSFHTSQRLIQAVSPGASPLLQLPHFDNKIVKSVEGDLAKNHMSVQQYMELNEEKRRKLSVGQGLLTEKQYQSALTVARQLPALNISKAFFKVVGEKVITPSSLVQLVVKARFIPPGYPNVPEVSEADLEDVDPDEADIDAIAGRKDTKSDSDDTNGEPVQPPLAHAPFFARDYSPRWFVFLGDARQGKMAVPPFSFSTFGKPIFDSNGKPTFNVQTLKMQFQAPPQVGTFNFVLYLMCDSYIGLDSSRDITLKVDDLAKAAALADEDEISEPDEGMKNLYLFVVF